MERSSGRREHDRHTGPGIRRHDAADAAALLERHGLEILSRGAFYDLPVEARKNIVDVLNGMCEVAGMTFGMVDIAPYPLFLAQLRD